MVSESFAAPGHEFAGIAELAATAGLGHDAVPGVHRSWVTVPGGEHIGAVVWGSGPPEVVFVHDAGHSARAWDEVALRLGRPSVAIDLPGHGRSDGRRDGHYEPRKLAGTLAEAIRSLAPRVSLVVGSGLGGRTSLALITTPRPTFLPRVALIDTLPGTAVDAQFDDLTLWEELAGLENPAFVIRGEHSGRLAPADLLDLRRRAPRVAVVTIPGTAEDVVASEPARLASELSRLARA
jgi:pimeloyl-ACP methyl ester carboxylesterase